VPEGFLRLSTVEEVIGLLEGALGAVRPEVEEVPLAAALGRVLAGDFAAGEDMPGFRRSTMDGYAVRSRDVGGAAEERPAYLELAGEVPMGGLAAESLADGHAMRISTGGALPEGADAVVMVENTELVGDTVEVLKGVAVAENTVGPDEDVAAGEVLIGRGRVLGPAQLGAMAGLGVTSIMVFGVPRVGIMSTGDELVAVEETPAPGQVRDINSMALAASVARAGCEPVTYGIVPDVIDEMLTVARRALGECDALIISGGSSAGVRDLTVKVLSALGPPGVLAHGIYLKPGKPTLAAVCGGKPAFGLPGNPASAMAVFGELVAPVLLMLRGERPGPASPTPRVAEAVLTRSVASATGRVDLVPVRLSLEGGTLQATPVTGKSSLIGTLARADGQLRVAAELEGIGKGQVVIVELLE